MLNENLIIIIGKVATTSLVILILTKNVNNDNEDKRCDQNYILYI